MSNTNEVLFKFLDNDKKGNTVNCIASFTGRVDRHERVLFPNVWKDSIPHFIKDGAIYVEHNYQRDSIGTAVSAIEIGNRLQLTWEFLDTEEAANQKAIIQQRMERGKNHYMSNGFRAKTVWFENGELLLKYAERMGHDMSLFDSAGIASYADYIMGIIAIPEDGWYESSVTDRPAIKEASILNMDSDKDKRNQVQFFTNSDLEKLLAESNSQLITQKAITDFERQLLVHKIQAHSTEI